MTYAVKSVALNLGDNKNLLEFGLILELNVS